MRPELDPSRLTPDERLREVAAVFAAGLLRLRDRTALPDQDETPGPGNPAHNIAGRP
jgi:hypothetical protein